jgi:WD40 repeat protein
VSTPPGTSPPGGEDRRIEARATEGARIYQAGRDQNIAQRDLHLHYEDGVRRARRAAREAPAGECPYPGLAAFDEDQARWFFGRESVTAELLVRLDERLREGGAMAVVAPSGAGKSSLLRAGLLPALARGALPAAGSAAWPRLLLTPGAHPVATLAACLAEATGTSEQEMIDALAAGPQTCVALLREVAGGDGRAAGGQLVVVVDQLEELFTLCTSERERRDFMAVLTALAHAGPDSGPAALVVYGLRSDFYTPCADYPQLRAVLQNGQLVVGPMTEIELREVILFPAREAGLEVEAGLVELLLRDLGTPAADGPQGSAGPVQAYEAGRLPLLAHALRATWQQRHGHTLTVDGYRTAGGIRHAVSTTAQRLYVSLTSTDQQLARTLFLRLVRIGDGVDDTRRRLPYMDLLDTGEDSEAAAAVIDAFTRGRLLTRDQDSVEITHEALLHAWPELRRWIDTDRAGHLIHQGLEEDAADWDRAHRDVGMLYRGHRLEAARAWADHPHQNRPSFTATAFLAASTRHAHRAARLRRSVIAILTALALLASVTAVIAFQQRGSAQDQRATAQAQRNEAVFNQIRAEAESLRGTQASLAAQLDLVAHRMRPDDPDIHTDLIADASNFLSKPLVGDTDVSSAVLSPDGQVLATGGQEGARLSDMSERRPVGKPFTTRAVNSLAFSPDGRTLAGGVEGNGNNTVALWDVTDLTSPRPLATPLTGHSGAISSIAFSPDGRTLATSGFDGTARLWDMTNRANPRPLGKPLDNREVGFAVVSVAFSPDGRMLVTGRADGAQLWDMADRAEPRPLGNPLNTAFADTEVGAVRSVAFSPDGRILAAGGFNGLVGLWDVADRGHPKMLGRLLPATATGVAADSDWVSLAFSPDARSLVTAVDGEVRLWDLTDPGSPELASQLLGHTGLVYAVAFDRDGHALITAGEGSPVLLWTDPRARLFGHTRDVHSVAFSPDGHTLASGAYDGTRVWDVNGRTYSTSLGYSLPNLEISVGSVAFSSVRTLATAGFDGTRLWDVTDLSHPKPVASPLTNVEPGITDNSVAFSPDGRTLASVGNDGVRLWDVTDRTHPEPLGKPFAKGGPSSILSALFSPDGDTLATAGDDGVRLWDVRNRNEPRPLYRPSDLKPAFDMAFSADGNTMAAVGDDGVRLWDVTDRTRPKRLGPSLPTERDSASVAFSPNRQILATAGDNGVQLWDLTDRTHPEPLGEILTKQTASVAFSRDGHTLATGGDYGVVRLWETDTDHAIDRICLATQMTLTRQLWEQHLPGLPFDPPCG